jgi:hypothetical protein
MKRHILKMQRTPIVYTLKVVKILPYEEEIPNYVQISCIDDVKLLQYFGLEKRRRFLYVLYNPSKVGWLVNGV